MATFRKENHPDEAQVRRGRRMALYTRGRDFSKGPNEKPEMQRKVLRQGKNLAFSKNTCLAKERVQSKETPKKVEVGLKQKGKLNKRWAGD